MQRTCRSRLTEGDGENLKKRDHIFTMYAVAEEVILAKATFRAKSSTLAEVKIASYSPIPATNLSHPSGPMFTSSSLRLYNSQCGLTFSPIAPFNSITVSPLRPSECSSAYHRLQFSVGPQAVSDQVLQNHMAAQLPLVGLNGFRGMDDLRGPFPRFRN